MVAQKVSASNSGRQGILRRRSVAALVASCSAILVTLVIGAQPAAASGGATISVPADGVWRTKTFTVSDATILSACPGPTKQTLSITATMKATSAGYYMQSIFMTNTTSGVNFDYRVWWDDQEKIAYAKPYPWTNKWSYGTKRLLTSNGLNGVFQTVTNYQKWQSNTGLHTLTVENGGGIGCWPVFKILVRKG